VDLHHPVPGGVARSCHEGKHKDSLVEKPSATEHGSILVMHDAMNLPTPP
jgi:hypothetical protein